MNEKEPLLKIRDLNKQFTVKNKKILRAVDGFSLDIYQGETIGLVGESGCGKSTVGNMIIRLLPATSGDIYYRDQNILSLKDEKKREYCKKIQMVFQDPYSSLNPRKRIKEILSEPFEIWGMAKGKDKDKKVAELIEKVNLETYVLEKYPHELDGGKRQLVGIARALALSPEFIICDEPVSSLDVSIQATIINLLIDLREQYGLTYLFISHDLSVVRHISTRIVVMYLGKIVEIADADELFLNPLHPYTKALLSAIPQIEVERNEKKERIILEGDVSSPVDLGEGCHFEPRCWCKEEGCKSAAPELLEVSPNHFVACRIVNDKTIWRSL